MNDEFLDNLRVTPSAGFASRLKQRLAANDAAQMTKSQAMRWAIAAGVVMAAVLIGVTTWQSHEPEAQQVDAVPAPAVEETAIEATNDTPQAEKRALTKRERAQRRLAKPARRTDAPAIEMRSDDESVKESEDAQKR